MADTPTKRQARSTVRLSSGVTQSLIETATEANAAYFDALQRGASESELHALAAAGLEAAERLCSNLETIIEATIQVRTSRWRSREKTESQVRATLGPRQAAAAQAVEDWRGRVSRHVGPAPPTVPATKPEPPRPEPPEDGTVRHVALMSDGSGVTFRRQAGQWVWRLDPGVPENVTTTALITAELKKLQSDVVDDDLRGSATAEE